VRFSRHFTQEKRLFASYRGVLAFSHILSLALSLLFFFLINLIPAASITDSRASTMGFDLFTVKPVKPEDFDKLEGDKGYFRYSSGVTDLLQMVGVPDNKCKRLCYQGNKVAPVLEDYPLSIYQAMSFNDGNQITPEECEMIASKMTNESFDKCILGKPNSGAWMFKNMGMQVPDDALYYDERDRKFFLAYSKYCKMAAKYGGFFVC
jgi:hypothetical protein